MKPNYLRDSIIIIVILAVSLLVFKTCFSDDRVVTDLPTYKEVKKIKDKKGSDHFQISNENPSKEIAEIDSLKKQLGVKEKEIERIMKFSGEVVDSLNLKRIEITDLKTKLWKWEKKLPSGSVLRAEMNEKDSILKTDFDIKVIGAEISEGGWFKKKRNYIDFYTPDQNIRFNGMEIFRKEIKEPKDLLQINLKNDLLIGSRMYYISEAEMLIFPDGRFIPKVGYGYLWDGKFSQFYKIGIDIPIIRIKLNQK